MRITTSGIVDARGTERALFSYSDGTAGSDESGQSMSRGGPVLPLPVLDVDGLLERMMGCEEIAWQILSEFLAMLPAEITRLERALDGNDPAVVERVAHGLAGAAGNVGAVALMHAAKEIETAAAHGRLGQSISGPLEQVRAQPPLLASCAAAHGGLGAPLAT